MEVALGAELGDGADAKLVAAAGHLETTSSSAHDGTFELRAGELVLTSARRGVTRRRVRIYDEYVAGRWTRAMSLLDEGATPASEVQYLRIDDTR